jgi:hypothetical protein
MSILESWIAATGYRGERQDFDCWRVECIGPASEGVAGHRATPSRSRALSFWLERLRDRPDASAYRIRPAAQTG